MTTVHALATADSAPDQKTRIERYKALLADLLATADTAELHTFTEHVTSEEVALVVSRQVLQEVALGLPSLPAAALKDIGKFVLDRIQPRVTSFEEQANSCRHACPSK